MPAVFSANFSDFDNSNPRISKIIELPYCPVIVSKNSDTGVYSFNGCEINYGYNILKVNLKNLSQLVTTDSRISELLYLTINNPTAKDSPNLTLESKLYSSEFYDFAYYYDTDKMPIRLEDVTPYSQNCKIQINYAQTLSMNSDKQFKFIVNNGDYNEIQPFEMYLNCARNTERLVLNSSYADYLKNGYNYDQ